MKYTDRRQAGLRKGEGGGAFKLKKSWYGPEIMENGTIN
jgi:hypothetical protein